MSFDTVLIANRGEIAVRVIRTAAAQGYRTVAVFSDADADAPHVRLADTAVRIGGPSAKDSYLHIDRLITAAKQSGAGAVHPGYGFLSENADFAQACAAAGLVFIGPTPQAIAAMGDKAAAKRLMADAGVPLLAGYHGVDQNDEGLMAEAARIGYPLMVKASAGGGGKGMRIVAHADALPDALAEARREALSAFGSDILILERALLRPRHVEVQILADTHGHVVALGERDCSVQRRHQKVVEETPSPTVGDEVRRAMCEAAVTAAKTVGYVGAGTVEFIVDADNTFAFLEMNTRLQVEHPVTEMVTGIDLVAWQLRIAEGQPLTLQQDEIQPRGHAIEVRLYAEDPSNGYLPAAGRIELWCPPVGEGVRVDAGIATGTIVTPHYDPMLAKIIAHGRDRDEARRRLVTALENTVLLGVTTNRAFLARILRDPTFAAGAATTALLAQTDLASGPMPATRDIAVAAALLHRHKEKAVQRHSPEMAGWTNATSLHSSQRLQVADRIFDVQLTRTAGTLRISVDGATHVVDAALETESAIVFADGSTVSVGACHVTADRVAIGFPHLDLDARDVLFSPPETHAASGTGVITAPMHGTVAATLVEVGAEVTAGQPLLVLEAMKMEQRLVADVDGVVTEIAAPGVQAAADEIVARIQVRDEESA